VGIGVGVAVGVAVGVLVGVAVVVGNGVALGADVGVGADAGAQADKIRLTSKSKTNVRFIVRFLLWRSSRPTIGASAAARSERSEQSGRLEAQVGGLLSVPNKCIIKCLKDCIVEEFRIAFLIERKRPCIGDSYSIF